MTGVSDLRPSFAFGCNVWGMLLFCGEGGDAGCACGG